MALNALQYCRQKIAYMQANGEWYSPGRAIEKADEAIIVIKQALAAQTGEKNGQHDKIRSDLHGNMVVDRDASHDASSENFSSLTGHCKEKAKPGGCRLHNLQCGYPVCDRKPAITPPAKSEQEPSGVFRHEDMCGNEVAPPTPYYLAPPAAPVQEPVATVAEVHMSRYTLEWTNGPLPEGTKLYTTPPAARRQSTSLTVEQIVDIAKKTQTAEPGRDGYVLPCSFARAIEAAHGIQQTK